MSDGPGHVLVTGASSGIGAALARAYAGPGRRLTLGGRDRARLDAVAAACRAAGAEVATAIVDVREREAVRAWIESADDAAPLDLVIANAGISAGTGGGAESETQAREIFATNLDGVLNTAHPAIDRMAARGRGQLALMASLAGYRGFPGAPAYSASKAAVLAYGEALRGDLAGRGLTVSVICPGFVESPMTAVNPFPMPFLVPAGRAARIVRRGLARGRAVIVFPWPMRALGWLLRLLPSGFVTARLARLPGKGRRAGDHSATAG